MKPVNFALKSYIDVMGILIAMISLMRPIAHLLLQLLRELLVNVALVFASSKSLVKTVL